MGEDVLAKSLVFRSTAASTGHKPAKRCRLGARKHGERHIHG